MYAFVNAGLDLYVTIMKSNVLSIPLQVEYISGAVEKNSDKIVPMAPQAPGRRFWQAAELKTPEVGYLEVYTSGNTRFRVGPFPRWLFERM